MQETLDRLKAGIRRFRTGVYPGKATTFQEAVQKPQTPQTLMITCADSRIDPETITGSGTGDLFLARNIGNLVPAYNDAPGGVSAVIEYAVSALKVKHIVICGHSDCGAMKALAHPASMESLPAVKAWMKNAADAATSARALADTDETPHAFLSRLTEENVLLQIQRLRTHPSVVRAIAAGQLTISGWVYDIGSGEIRISEDGTRTFLPVGADGPLT